MPPDDENFTPSPVGYWPSPEQEQVFRAVQRHDLDAIRDICAKHPHAVTPCLPSGQGWIDMAVVYDHQPVEIIEALLDAGFDPNAHSLPRYHPALDSAPRHPQALRVTKLLLDCGADIRLGRPAIAALLNPDNAVKIQVLQLLIERGLDINKLYDNFGDQGQLFTVLDRTSDPEALQIIKAAGGRLAVELVGFRAAYLGQGPTAHIAQILEHFQKQIGPVGSSPAAITLPSSHPVLIFIIKPGLFWRKHNTLFTVGLSGHKMNVPSGQEAFQHAEIYLQLPKTWPQIDLSTPATSWPMRWLEKLARHPQEQNTWLSSNATIIANDNQPLAPDVPFTAFLLIADRTAKTKDGASIHFYRAIPIHPSEHAYAIKEGPLVLLAALEKKKAAQIIDIHRPPAV
jgi:hypothetical protein